jgi:flagellin
MIISHNIAALNTINNLKQKDTGVSKNLEKLSSGLRINRASDDAAGLAISEKIRGQIRGLNQASRNIQDGISLIQTADGAMQEIHSMLQRMNELAVQASNGTYNNSDRANTQSEYSEMLSEINNIAHNTEFNNMKLLNGEFNSSSTSVPGSFFYANGGTKYDINDGWIQIGGTAAKVKMNPGEQVINDPSRWMFSDLQLYADIDSVGAYGLDVYTTSGLVIVHNHPSTTFSYNGMTFDVSDVMNTWGGSGGNQHQGTISLNAGNNDGAITGKSLILQIGTNLGDSLFLDLPNVTTSVTGISNTNISTITEATNSINLLKNAINAVSSERAKMGAYQNRLKHSQNNVLNYAENLTTAESRIRDIDMAKEMMQLIKNQIITQAGQAMLVQANQQPQTILHLFN